MSDFRETHADAASSAGDEVSGGDVETGTATGGASAFPGAPSAAPDEPGPEADAGGDDEGDDVDTTTDSDGQPLDNPSGG